MKYVASILAVRLTVRDVTRRILPGAFLTACAASISGQQLGIDLMRPPTPDRSVEVRDALPSWVALPRSARVLTSKGVEMRALKNSAVTLENAKSGVLVGALRNAGGCAKALSVRLQYADANWRPVGQAIESEVSATRVEPGGILPYRFRLLKNEDFQTPPAAYILQVAEEGRPVAQTIEWISGQKVIDSSPCPPPPVAIETQVKGTRATLSGYRVTGSLTLSQGGPVRPEAIGITALLLDDRGEVLEVLIGRPTPKPKDLPAGVVANGQPLPFVLSTPVPLGRAVAKVEISTELLSDDREASPSGNVR